VNAPKNVMPQRPKPTAWKNSLVLSSLMSIKVHLNVILLPSQSLKWPFSMITTMSSCTSYPLSSAASLISLVW
jgi:hypothetical protein